MKQFAVYTLARFALFAVTYLVVWLVTMPWFDNTVLDVAVLIMISWVISSIGSLFLLRRPREAFARRVQDRAERMTQRIEESRSAEDLD